MLIRSAKEEDITEILAILKPSDANNLIDPPFLSEDLCRDFIDHLGKIWMCDQDEKIVALGLVDVENSNLLALYENPEYRDYKCGEKLHEISLDWYFAKKEETLQLRTSEANRIEGLLLRNGWSRAGVTEAGEALFEITKAQWQEIRRASEVE